jgi:hypothetical protein
MGLMDNGFFVVGTAVLTTATIMMNSCIHDQDDYEKGRAAEEPRRELAIHTLRERSRANCPEISVPGAAENYSLRFYRALNRLDAAELETAASKNVIVCLDSRLGNQNRTSHSPRIIGVYYPEKNILSIYDNGNVGQPEEDQGIGSSSHSFSLISRFNRSTSLQAAGEVSYASRYTYKIGKVFHSDTRWDPASKFNAEAQEINPGLQHAPELVH